MKYLQLSGLCLLLSFICVTTSAQNSIPVNEPDLNKPKLFANLPDKIPVDIITLQNLLNAETGKDVSLKLGQNALSSFNGKVVSKADDNSIHSVVTVPP
jgi:biopolymer transport protein ExbD